MAAADKKSKTDSAPKKEPAPKDKGTPSADSKSAPSADSKSAPSADAPTAKDSDKAGDKSGEKADAAPAASPAKYSRGEGQKPVTQEYKDNWNAIFGKKKKR